MSSVADFDFNLPSHLIAQEPRARGTSRLLVVDRASGSWREHTVADLPSLLSRGDCLVANDTRVFPARLIGRREPSGGAAECFLLERRSAHGWLALVHPGQKLKPGAHIIFEDAVRAPGVRIHAVVGERQRFGRRLVELSVEREGAAGAEAPAAHPDSPASERDAGAPPGDAPARHADDLDEAVDRIGHIPLPPYIHRADAASDRERYQTVFARARGSVAAPTAGLHFTDAIIGDVRRSGLAWTTITHHVGYGTFKPVRVETVEEHTVDAETYTIGAAAAAAIAASRRAGRRVVAVGTTTTRALESAAIDDGLGDHQEEEANTDGEHRMHHPQALEEMRGRGLIGAEPLEERAVGVHREQGVS